MTRVFALTSHKGGVGKSTSATTIALGIASVLKAAGAHNSRVLLVDTDSQGHATLITTGRNDYGATNSLYTALMVERQAAAQTMANCIVPSTSHEDLHVLPASPILEATERELTGVAGAPYRLSEPLSRIANHYAAIVIDTRPSFSLMTEMGLIAAMDAIVPVEPRYLETVGLLSVIQKIHDIRDGWRQPSLRVSGVLVTKLEPEIAAFATACLNAALDLLQSGKYPVSQAMRELLDDIERNGDSAKLWLTEQCVIEPEAVETTQALYEDYRVWCDTNGLRALSRPRLRDAILSYSRAIQPVKRRVLDKVSGESRPMWCLVGIRLRQSSDQ